MKIIGAGLSGLLAGCMFPGSVIYERQSQLPNNHGAILRFRSPEIGEALGIPFKKVRVAKAIWFDGNEVFPTPRIMNMYSYKVLGEYTPRSIGNIDPVDRWIAPDNFIEQLAERCNIVYERDIDRFDESEPTISTIPMPIMIKMMFHSLSTEIEFKCKPIWTTTFTCHNVDLYQTIYFPGDETNLYRASFTGNKMICEYARDPAAVGGLIPLEAFGMYGVPYDQDLLTSQQKYGKIIDIDPDIRRSIMRQLTVDYNIYSLGRFATWRNILLDDVFKDIRRIREMTQMDTYSRHMALTEES